MTQLHLDLHGSTRYLTSPWSYGVNVSHASALLRKEVQRHLIMGRDELGFRHVRFAGIFDDTMAVLQPDGSYDFSRVERVLDWLMEQGFSPFIALNGVPRQLLQAGDAATPAGFDQDKWVDMARALAAFVDGRYGCDAQEWHFEVWPGADNPAIWTGTAADYYRFYDLTARAIKRVNAMLKVGGASARDADWTIAWIDHLAQPSEVFSGKAADTAASVASATSASAAVADAAGDDSVAVATSTAVASTSETSAASTSTDVLDVQRCDFITVSGLTDGVCDGREVIDRLSPVRIKLTEALGETVPVLLSAWSRGGTGLSAENDQCGAGGFVAGVAASAASLVEGMLYDQMSDVDQPDAHSPTHVRYDPFHGGRGLVTVNDVRKASFNAFRLLNEHVGYTLEWRWQEQTNGLSALVTKDYHNVIRVLASYQRPADQGAGGKPSPARFSLEGLPEHVKYGQVQVLRPSAGSAQEAWLEAGKPMFINRYLLDDLEAGAHPATAEVNFQEFPPRLESGMTLQLTIPLPDDLMPMD